MKKFKAISRRTFLGSAAWVVGAFASQNLNADAPRTPASRLPSKAATSMEEKVNFYTALELGISEALAKQFESLHPGIRVLVERTGSERLFQRIHQEKASGIASADVVCSADAAHFVAWKRLGWLAKHLPAEVLKRFPTSQMDADATYATVTAWLCVVAYNTNLVTPEKAPIRLSDLLNAEWKSKLVKAHPGYSGTILTATANLVNELGWGFFEHLARQDVLHVQSAFEPPKKLSLGERAVQVDGVDSMVTRLREQGHPLQIVYPPEGSPIVHAPSGIMIDAPHPNAARAFQDYLFSAKAQQLMVDVAAQHSFHPDVRIKAGRKRLEEIPTLSMDPRTVEAQAEDIKRKYTKIFKV